MKAYPFIHKHPTTGNTRLEEGMDLRDYFAGQAMKYMGLPTKVSYGRIGNNEWSLQEMETFPYDDMAKVAYKWADAMLKAREVKNDQP